MPFIYHLYTTIQFYTQLIHSYLKFPRQEQLFKLSTFQVSKYSSYLMFKFPIVRTFKPLANRRFFLFKITKIQVSHFYMPFVA